MNVMICFEADDKQEQIRKQLSAKGYMSSWKVKRGSKDQLTFHLPSNCLWKKGENMSPTKAKEELKKIAAELKVKIIRAVAITIGKFDGMTGTPSELSETVAQSVEAES